MPFNSRLGVFDDEQFNDFSKDEDILGCTPVWGAPYAAGNLSARFSL